MIKDDLQVHLFRHHLVVKPSKVDLLRIAHVKHILKKCEMTEDILVWHLNRKSSLCSNAVHCGLDVNLVNEKFD